MPKVSVILPNYNHAKFLTQRLNTILNQTFQDFELIILDDCSTDNSREIIENYRNHPKISKILINDVNSGSSIEQWIKGVESAESELIWIAESDDWCELNFLEKLIPNFNHSNVSMTVSSVRFIFENLNNYHLDLIFDDIQIEGLQFIRDKMLGKCGIPNASMIVFRKEVFLKHITKKLKQFIQVGDWYLWINMLNGYQVVTTSEINCYFRIHDTNTTGKNRKNGLDFIEGLDVYEYGRKICNNKFVKSIVYKDWFKSFIGFVGYFNKGILIKVLIKFLKTDILLFFYVLLSFIKFKVARQYQKKILGRH